METLSIKRHIPNIITIFRIILVIPIIVFMLINPLDNCYWFNVDHHLIKIDWNHIIVLILFLIASISDWLDGFLSRKYHWVSDLGKILDPIADKILINSLFILLSIQTKVYVVFTIIFIFRDIVMDALRMFASKKNIIIAANWSGKLKTVLQMLAIILVLIIGVDMNSCFDWWYWGLQHALIYLSIIASITSAFIYIIKFIKLNKPVSGFNY